MIRVRILLFYTISLILITAVSGRGRHFLGNKQALKFLKTHKEISHVRRNVSISTGLWPSIFNLATKAVISVNATCGEDGRQEFCRMIENGRGRCGVCDSSSPDPSKRHSITYAIDGSNRWWQSPSLFYGSQYEYITIDIDLKQIYQVAYIIVKAANSPRPGTWIIERSLDGEIYEAWQYFARSDKECIEQFSLTATKGKPHYYTDSEVICTSYYSRLSPVENGEIHISLIHGRPGAKESSPELLEFTKARFVRLRLIGLRGTVEPLPRWFSQDISRDKRLFYSIRDISIAGQCVCNGHAENCRHNVASGHPECECSHHTCGSNCEKCCPMYNQRQWGPGTSRDSRQCLPCNCHGHASSCHYDEEVDRAGLSMDINGNYQGGGVCDNCTAHTRGINCELCIDGYYRVSGTPPDAENPCLKCDCDPLGSLGTCVQHGERAGLCNCKIGYAGEKCNTCAPGYRGYPNCELCPCDPKGVTDMSDCEGECICKPNVEGKYCDRCKSGHFGLSSANPAGCISCFCSGVTTVCESFVVKRREIQTLHDWLVSDLRVSRIVKPTVIDQTIFSASYELPGVESFYWLAPEEFLGYKLEAYDSIMRFKVHWTVMRGDTSGEPISGPNILIVGTNEMEIGYGDDIFSTSPQTFEIKLNEQNFYHIPKTIKDITSNMVNREYKGKPVSRNEFMSILTHIKHILLRGKFHTDQAEALLEDAVLVVGEETENDYFSTVERCSCPSGYTGLSCEKCSFGYVRIFTNSSNNTFQPESFCVKCDCNGHSETCNADTGECFCQNNTVGEKCERCATGYYGNPLLGTPGDCKKCKCPLENEENNFSPICQLDHTTNLEEEEAGYVCTQCPIGYTGDHCEICDTGYFGNPLEVGNKCVACECNGSPCDRITGQCLSCRGNTEGWKCDKCKQDHYGNATVANCKPCECDPIGSESKQCDVETGQCFCKEKFIGRTCNKCELGYGNVTALCVPCLCNSIGSKSEICDPHSGICECLPGIEGFHCDTCQSLYYGFSNTGCKECECDEKGSLFAQCDIITGHCRCKPNYTGRNCDRCVPGFYKNPNYGCQECTCSKEGSIGNCNEETGTCLCKEGVDGDTCNICKVGYYGNISTSCKECDPCEKEGHICDPFTGKCVCPPFTEGSKCDKCISNSWGLEPNIGCKNCNCSESGSSSLQCNLSYGTCNCKTGYEGEKCDRCSFGYYGYPNCQKCNCNENGTLTTNCINGICKCSDDGTCDCKELVQGKKCETCTSGTFGLSSKSVKGCTECFCFGRSKKCFEGRDFRWDKIRSVQLSKMNDNCENDFCWKLPDKFLGDLTKSYGGYLTVSPPSLQFSVKLSGNGVLIKSIPISNEILFKEDFWNVVYFDDPLFEENCKTLNRPCFLVVLQNTTEIIIDSGGSNGEIEEVLLDRAKVDIPSSYRNADGIEQCHCPKQYGDLSCQEPSDGYYKTYLEDLSKSWIDKKIGSVKKCDCNNRSDTCDKTTGICMNCTGNFYGNNCEVCANGYYEVQPGICVPCLCPDESQNNAEKCEFNQNKFLCTCKKGYTGLRCEKCQIGYFQSIQENNLPACLPCECNTFGSVHSSCDFLTGECKCKQGFTGPKCSSCENPREVIQNGTCKPCGECTQILFKEVDKLTFALQDAFELFKGGLSPPWKLLAKSTEKKDILQEDFEHFIKQSSNIIHNNNLNYCSRQLGLFKEKFQQFNISNVVKTVKTLKNNTDLLTKDLNENRKKLNDIRETFKLFGKRINVKEALFKATEILKEMDYIYGNFEDFYSSNINCGNVYEDVMMTFKENGMDLNDSRKKLIDMKNRIEAFNNVTHDVHEMSKQAKKKNSENFGHLNKLNSVVENLKSDKSFIEKNMKECDDKIEATKEKIEDLRDVLEKVNKLELYEPLEELEKRNTHLMENLPENAELLRNVQNHVNGLKIKLRLYQSFNFTPDEWKAINASNAYKSILEAVNEAANSAKISSEITDRALFLIDSEQTESLPDSASISHAFSDRLKKRITNLKPMSGSTNNIINKMSELKYSIFKVGAANNNITGILQDKRKQIERQSKLFEDIDDTLDSSISISEEMQNIKQKVENMDFIGQHSLQKEYMKYKEYKMSGKDIDQILTSITSIKELNDKIHQSRKIEKNYNSDSLTRIKEQINVLQDKILYAKQIANTVNIALNFKDCIRRYSLPKADIFRSLKINFRCKSCELFNWENSLTKDSLKLSVRNEKIHLKINDYPQISIESYPQTTMVELSRIGKTFYLISNRNNTKSFEVSKAFTFNPTDIITIGSNLESDEGCLFNVMINDINMGLWNFLGSEGVCKDCAYENLKSSSEQEKIFFNGQGYSQHSIALGPDPFNINFEFETFDENSIIYLAEDFTKPGHCSYLILCLQNGHVNFQIQHIDGTAVSMTSKNKYNKGLKTTAEISMAFKNNKMIYNVKLIDDVSPEEVLQREMKLEKKYLFKIKKAEHYLGGVTPIYNDSCVPIKVKSFLGYLDVKPKSSYIQKVISYGQFKKYDKLKLPNAWINKYGKIKLSTDFDDSLETFNLSFFLIPQIPDGLKMSINNLPHIYIENYKAKFNQFTFVLLNEESNYFELTANSNRIKICINEECSVMPTQINLTNTIEIVLTSKGFVGGISDLVINERMINFEASSVKSFNNVEIGRNNLNKQWNILSNNLAYFEKDSNQMQNTEGCSSSASYEQETEAVHLGDKPNTYVYIKNFNWKNNFTLQFDFRTFYPSGILLISLGKQPQNHYTLVELREGRIEFYIRGKRKKLIEMHFEEKVNDGKWHSLKLIHTNSNKRKRMLTLSLDENQTIRKRISKNLIKNEIFLGGIGDGFENIHNIKPSLSFPFRGCIKSLIINDESVSLKKNQKNLRPCFQKVEEGAYFGGDAYAIYKKDFQVDKVLELSFEFRSAEQSGILLSVSNYGNSPALSIELENGAVVMTVDMGNGVTSNVTNNLNSDFALCDNRWHNVTALYSSLELTVNVDGIRKSWVQSEVNSLLDEINSALYIGGLKDNHPYGTLRTRENFKGCIRKLKISDTLMDWTDMEELNNVLLHSCPI